MIKFMGIIALLVVSTIVSACDVCGGASGFGGIGYLPSSAFHFVGLSYGNRQYAIQHPQLFADDPILTGSNITQSLELSGRWQATKKIQILAFVPYRINTLKENADLQSNTIQGLGDASIILNYHVLNKPNLKSFAGGGAKLPTGKSNRATNNVVVPNMQVGSSSWDALFMWNTTYLKNKFGFNNETLAKLNSGTKWDYKYGNQVSSTFTFFYKKRMGNFMFLPQIGTKFDYQTKGLSSVKYQIIDMYSGVQMMSFPLGVDLYRKNMGARLKYEIPGFYMLSEGLVKPKPSVQIQFLYVIPKK